jgi:biotin carboxyl carrier protein
MKITAEMAGEKHELNIKRDGSHVSAEIDGRRYEVKVRETGPGSYLLTAGTRVYECHVDREAKRREAMSVNVGSHHFAVSLIDPKRLHSAPSTGAQADGTAQIVAPMPGKVVRVLTEAGAQVKAGDGILVVEAMKMQNEMKSPRDGIVAEIKATAGETVNAGQVLAIIE